jgi:hypothetical protein
MLYKEGGEMKTTRISQRWMHLGLALCGALMLTISLVVAAGASSAEEMTRSPSLTAGYLTGTVTDPDGQPPPAGTHIKLRQPDGTLAGQATVARDTGAFTLGPAPNGNYVLRAVPPDASPLTPSFLQVVHLTGAAINVGTLALTYPCLSGTVVGPNGVTPPAAWVGIYRTDGQLMEGDWAPDGQYQMGGLITGTYVLKARPTGNEPYWWSNRIIQTITPTLPQITDLQLQIANVFGAVESPGGNPIQSAVAHVYRLDAPGHARDESNAGGYFSVGGLVTGTYALRVEPPYWRSDLLPTDPIIFGVPPLQTNVGLLRFRSSPKVVEGAVHTNLGDPVEKALILAHRVNATGQARTLSATDGSYQLRLSAGTWALTVRPISSTVPAEWVYPLPPQVVHFAYDENPELKAVGFQVLTADSNVIGEIELPGGGAPALTVTVQLRNSEGVGAGQMISPDGSFDIALPHGAYKVSVHSADPQYVGPPLPVVNLPPTSTVYIGTITLIPRDALITGTVKDTNSVGVDGVRVTGWTRDHIYGEAMTGPDGSYTMAVISGTWRVSAAPSPELPYIYTGTHQVATVASGETAPDVEFQLTTADATIVGNLVAQSGDPAIEAFGWASAQINGAPVENGTFTIRVPSGEHDISVKLAANSPYLAPGAPTNVAVSVGQTATVTITLRDKDATMKGGLWDRRSSVVITGVEADVLAWSDWAMVETAIDPANGTFSMDVSADLWHLGYRVDPAANYAQLTHRKQVPVQSGQTILVSLPVAEKDSLLTGTVLDPAGDPYTQTTIIADGIGWGMQEVTLKTRPGYDGRFHLRLPHGVYNLRAVGGPEAGYLNPTIKRLLAPPGTIPGLDLQFQEPDAIISGTVIISGTPGITGTALVWGWSPAGAYSKSAAELGGAYTLAAISNTTWHVGGVYETETAFWAARESVILGSGNATQDLTLAGPYPKSSPAVVTWNAADPQFVSLTDGTSIYLPAGSLPVSGTVTLHIGPIAALPHQPHADVFKYGWAFEAVDSQGQPIISSFHQNVIVAFRYDDYELVDWGIEEDFLKPAYFSTSTNSWTFPDSYILDTDTNLVVMQIDHFTNFALVASGDTMYNIYLPAIIR